MAPSPPHIMAFALIIIVDWDIDVNSYLLATESEMPEEIRPKVCKYCGQEIFQRKHGSYSRKLYTLTACILLIIYRFYCPSCKKTHSYIPSFFRKHHPMANEVQEAAVERIDQGSTCEEAATVGGSNMTVDVKTVQRWKKFWGDLLKTEEERFVQTALKIVPNVSLPVGAKKEDVGTSYRWLSYLWKKITNEVIRLRSVNLFTVLLHFSLTVTADL